MITGRITQWTNGIESSLGGATVIVGNNINLDCGPPTGMGAVDILRNSGGIVGRTTTGDNGNFTINVPPGQYTIILWKSKYIPQTSYNITDPGTYNNSISLDTQPYGGGVRHLDLQYG